MGAGLGWAGLSQAEQPPWWCGAGSGEGTGQCLNEAGGCSAPHSTMWKAITLWAVGWGWTLLRDCRVLVSGDETSCWQASWWCWASVGGWLVIATSDCIYCYCCIFVSFVSFVSSFYPNLWVLFFFPVFFLIPLGEGNWANSCVVWAAAELCPNTLFSWWYGFNLHAAFWIL